MLALQLVVANLKLALRLRSEKWAASSFLRLCRYGVHVSKSDDDHAACGETHACLLYSVLDACLPLPPPSGGMLVSLVPALPLRLLH